MARHRCHVRHDTPCGEPLLYSTVLSLTKVLHVSKRGVSFHPRVTVGDQAAEGANQEVRWDQGTPVHAYETGRQEALKLS